MATLAPSQSVDRVLGLLRDHDGPWNRDRLSAADIDLYRSGYLSTMFRCRAGGETYLVSVKRHDAGGVRAAREFEVLSVLDGGIAPRALALDLSGAWFEEPVLVSDYVEPAPIRGWDAPNLDRLAKLMASIHADRRLLGLKADRDAPAEYSLARELADESRDLPSFRDSSLKQELARAHADLLRRIDAWQELFDGAPAAYIHGDLPHHHVFDSPRGWRTIHWEWSRRSHPARELARALWDLEMDDEREAYLLERYAVHAGAPVSPEALAVQRLLQYYYNAVHVAFWLDREAPADHPDWDRAADMAKVVSLWIRMETDNTRWKPAPVSR